VRAGRNGGVPADQFQTAEGSNAPAGHPFRSALSRDFPRKKGAVDSGDAGRKRERGLFPALLSTGFHRLAFIDWLSSTGFHRLAFIGWAIQANAILRRT